MKKKRGMILAGLLLCAVLMPGILPGAAKAELGTGALIVGGTDIVESGGTVNGETGTATLTYENNKPVLTLNGYSYTRPGDGSAVIYFGGETLIIRLRGNNSITTTGDRDGILCNGTVTMEGDSGSLTVRAGNVGIHSTGSLTVRSGSITSYGNTTGAHTSMSIFAENSFTVGGGTVTAIGEDSSTGGSYGIHKRRWCYWTYEVLEISEV